MSHTHPSNTISYIINPPLHHKISFTFNPKHTVVHSHPTQYLSLLTRGFEIKSNCLMYILPWNCICCFPYHIGKWVYDIDFTIDMSHTHPLSNNIHLIILHGNIKIYFAFNLKPMSHTHYCPIFCWSTEDPCNLTPLTKLFLQHLHMIYSASLSFFEKYSYDLNFAPLNDKQKRPDDSCLRRGSTKWKGCHCSKLM